MMRTKNKNGKYEFRIRTTSYDRMTGMKSAKTEKSEFCKRFRLRQALASEEICAFKYDEAPWCTLGLDQKVPG